jgi:NitT/TauT family transport system permease protein
VTDGETGSRQASTGSGWSTGQTRAVRRALALLVLLAAWETLSRIGWLDPFYVPPPSRVGGVVFDLVATGDLWPHLGATALAAFAGLLVGLVLGIGLGFAAALSPLVADLLEPVMILLNAIPRVILAPLFVIWLGIGLASKLALATILVAVLIFFAVYNGIKEVDRRLVERIQTLGGGQAVLVREVYIPSVTAWVMGNFKVAVGFAFTGAVVGEFVASSRGLGYLLQFAQSTYNAALTIALILIIMTFVLVLFAVAERLERRLLAWRYL